MVYKITSVVGLSSIAFKPKEIQVPSHIYEVASSKFNEFSEILNKARQLYDDKVKEVKARGEKPKAIAIKSEVLHQVVDPFLQQFKSDSPVKVVKSSNPRIPFSNESKEVVQKVSSSEVDDVFNNFESEILDDSIPDNKVEDFFEGEEDLFEGVEVISSSSEDLFEGVEVISSPSEDTGSSMEFDSFINSDIDFDKVMEGV